MFRKRISTKVSLPENKGLKNIDEIFVRLEKRYADILHSIVSKQLRVKKGEDPKLSQLYHSYAP